MAPASKIVFYDGHCGLCNRVVRWLCRLDTAGQLHYAPLDGAAARARLPRLPRDLDAIVYWREGRRPADSSDAVAAILRDLGWPWRALGALRWIPRGLRDGAYRALAGRRHRLFGRYDACPLPPAGRQDRFLK